MWTVKNIKNWIDNVVVTYQCNGCNEKGCIIARKGASMEVPKCGCGEQENEPQPMPVIKPCPHCKEDDHLEALTLIGRFDLNCTSESYVQCHACEMCGPHVQFAFETPPEAMKAKAIEAWNAIA